MKKIIPFLFASLFLLSACGDKKDDIQSSEPSETQEVTQEIPTDRIRDIETIEDFEYEIIDNAATITKYTGNSTAVEVPAEIEGVPVTKIGFYAFEAQYDVESIKLPETIELICQGAFMDCASMKSINLPESLTAIERGAFVSCTSLESLVIPSAVESIAMESFTACESMTSLTINNPNLEYTDWGLEELPNLTIYADENSAIYKWASEKGIAVSAL